MPPAGVVLSKTLADVLRVAPGDTVTIEVLEGLRPQRRVDVTGVVDDVLGLSIYMEITALHAMMREGDVVSGALLLIDPAQEATLSRSLKLLPAVAGAGFKRAVLQSFRATMAANMNLTIFVNLIFAGVIAFGVVYARPVCRSRSAATSWPACACSASRAQRFPLILLGELALLTLAALPVGWLFGYGLSAAIVQTVQSEVYRFPLCVSRQAVAWSFLGILGAALVSGARRSAPAGSARPRRRSEGQRIGMRIWKNARLIAVALIVVGIAAVALWPEAVEVDVTHATRGPLQVTIDEEGETRVDRFVVYAPVAGRLQRIELEPGDAVVRRKTVVARLAPTPPPLLDPRTRAELAAAIDAARAAVGSPCRSGSAPRRRSNRRAGRSSDRSRWSKRARLPGRISRTLRRRRNRRQRVPRRGGCRRACRAGAPPRAGAAAVAAGERTGGRCRRAGRWCRAETPPRKRNRGNPQASRCSRSATLGGSRSSPTCRPRTPSRSRTAALYRSSSGAEGSRSRPAFAVSSRRDSRRSRRSASRSRE